MNDIIRTFNLTVIFLKFTFNIKIYKKFEEFIFKLVNYHITKNYNKKNKNKTLYTTISSRRSKHFLKGKKN